jgi:hypothetical protein
MKKPTSSGVCLRCVEAQLTASLKGRQSNKEEGIDYGNAKNELPEGGRKGEEDNPNLVT